MDALGMLRGDVGIRLVVYGTLAALVVAVALGWGRRPVPAGHSPVVVLTGPEQAQLATRPEHVLGLSRPVLEPAGADPFFGAPPPAPAPPSLPLAVVAAPLAPPVPTAPDLNVDIVGRMTGVDGKERIYALHGGESIEIATGLSLPNGFVVKAIDSQAVHFEHTPTGIRRTLALPVLPSFGIR